MSDPSPPNKPPANPLRTDDLEGVGTWLMEEGTSDGDIASAKALFCQEEKQEHGVSVVYIQKMTKLTIHPTVTLFKV